MTNYNERLYEIIDKHRHDVDTDFSADIRHYKNTNETVDSVTQLIKELVAEAKPYRETIIDKWNKDRVDEVKATNAAMNAWADIYEQNLLKALEEV